MTQKMVHAVVHCINSVKYVNTKYGYKAIAEIQIIHGKKQEFWVSPKQGERLEKCFNFLAKGGGYSTNRGEVHLVLEETEKGLRFVWAGIHSNKKSDLKWLEEKFGITATSPYIGRIDLQNADNTQQEADASLIDA